MTRPGNATAADAASTLAAACVCGRLRRASRALTQRYDDAMAPSGLRVTQFSLLRALEKHGPTRVAELAARALLDRTAQTRALAPLAEQGLVRISKGRDARTREIALTRAGRATLSRAAPYWQLAQADVLNHLGREDVDALVGILREIESLHPTPSGDRA